MVQFQVHINRSSNLYSSYKIPSRLVSESLFQQKRHLQMTYKLLQVFV